jgi:hypothetical protein
MVVLASAVMAEAYADSHGLISHSPHRSVHRPCNLRDGGPRLRMPLEFAHLMFSPRPAIGLSFLLPHLLLLPRATLPSPKPNKRCNHAIDIAHIRRRSLRATASRLLFSVSDPAKLGRAAGRTAPTPRGRPSTRSRDTTGSDKGKVASARSPSESEPVSAMR